MSEDHYIFACVDPFAPGDEFYHGMGRGEPSDSHLVAISDLDVLGRIARIRAAGGEPVFRVIGKSLTEEEAINALSLFRKLDEINTAFAKRP
jgi:hypothetical protein